MRCEEETLHSEGAEVLPSAGGAPSVEGHPGQLELVWAASL